MSLTSRRLPSPEDAAQRPSRRAWCGAPLAALFLLTACATAPPPPSAPVAPGTAGPLSPDAVPGATWTRASTLVVWPNRDGHATLAHDGRLWVLGGWGLGPLNDVWVSEDGAGWREVTAAAPWAPRKGHGAAVFRGRMWVLGGSLGAPVSMDVWSSADGLEWRLETGTAPWGPRNDHAVVVFRDRLWILGGWAGGDRNDVWVSEDGVAWERAVESAPWPPRNSLAAAVHAGRLWVVGGWGARPDGSEGNLADVWSSADGVTWERVGGEPPWSPRNGHTLVSAAGRLWLLGGWADRGVGADGEPDEGNVNDVWWSEDGATWNTATTSAAWLPRNGHASVVHAGRLWVIGGWSHEIGGTSVNDLWWAAVER